MRCLRSRLPFFSLALLALTNLLSEGNTAEPIDWKQDFSEAKELAKTSSRDLFLLFTGRGWCAACEVLEAKVLSQDSFREAVQAPFMMVELDFPAEQSNRTSEAIVELQALQKKYIVAYFPTIVLADSTGKPYAYIAKYASFTGPEPIINLIQSAQRARQARDEYFHQADKSQGSERIIQLHRGLEAIAPFMDKPEEQEADALLTWYRTEIEEILSFNGDLPEGIVETYQQRIRAQAASETKREIDSRLHEFEAAGDFSGAVTYLDERLKPMEDGELRRQLELSRIAFLEHDKQNQRALTQSRTLLRNSNLDPAYREHLLNREAYNLFCLNRIEEALAHYDQRIEAAADEPEKRLRLMGWKAQHAFSRLEPDRSIPIWETYRRAIGNKSADWFDTTVLLARQYQKVDQHAKAITLFEEALVEQDDAWVFIDLIRSLQAAGHNDQAKQLLAKVRAEQARLEASSRVADRDEAKNLAQRLQTITDSE